MNPRSLLFSSRTPASVAVSRLGLKTVGTDGSPPAEAAEAAGARGVGVIGAGDRKVADMAASSPGTGVAPAMAEMKGGGS